MVFKKGDKFSEEHRKHLSEAHKGHTPWNKDKKDCFSIETIQKMSKSRIKGLKGGTIKIWNKDALLSKENRRNISVKTKEAMKNPEVRRKISEAKKGTRSHRKGKLAIEEYGINKAEEIKIKIKQARAKQIFPIKDTVIEQKIQNFLKTLHTEFLTHYYISEITHSYQCDIFIPSKKLIIETDGCYWHGCKICNKNLNEFQEKQIQKDKIRTKELIEKGYKIIRLWEHDINKMELNDLKDKI